MTEYQRYQLEWMLEHGYSIQDLIDELTDCQYDALLYEDDVGMLDNSIVPIATLFKEWEQDYGFGSEIWACESEWKYYNG